MERKYQNGNKKRKDGRNRTENPARNYNWVCGGIFAWQHPASWKDHAKAYRQKEKICINQNVYKIGGYGQTATVQKKQYLSSPLPL